MSSSFYVKTLRPPSRVTQALAMDFFPIVSDDAAPFVEGEGNKYHKNLVLLVGDRLDIFEHRGEEDPATSALPQWRFLQSVPLGYSCHGIAKVLVNSILLWNVDGQIVVVSPKLVDREEEQPEEGENNDVDEEEEAEEEGPKPPRIEFTEIFLGLVPNPSVLDPCLREEPQIAVSDCGTKVFLALLETKLHYLQLEVSENVRSKPAVLAKTLLFGRHMSSGEEIFACPRANSLYLRDEKFQLHNVSITPDSKDKDVVQMTTTGQGGLFRLRSVGEGSSRSRGLLVPLWFGHFAILLGNGHLVLQRVHREQFKPLVAEEEVFSYAPLPNPSDPEGKPYFHRFTCAKQVSANCVIAFCAETKTLWKFFLDRSPDDCDPRVGECIFNPLECLEGSFAEAARQLLQSGVHEIVAIHPHHPHHPPATATATATTTAALSSSPRHVLLVLEAGNLVAVDIEQSSPSEVALEGLAVGLAPPDASNYGGTLTSVIYAGGNKAIAGSTNGCLYTVLRDEIFDTVAELEDLHGMRNILSLYVDQTQPQQPAQQQTTESFALLLLCFVNATRCLRLQDGPSGEAVEVQEVEDTALQLDATTIAIAPTNLGSKANTKTRKNVVVQVTTNGLTVTDPGATTALFRKKFSGEVGSASINNHGLVAVAAGTELYIYQLSAADEEGTTIGCECTQVTCKGEIRALSISSRFVVLVLWEGATMYLVNLFQSSTITGSGAEEEAAGSVGMSIVVKSPLVVAIQHASLPISSFKPSSVMFRGENLIIATTDGRLLHVNPFDEAHPTVHSSSTAAPSTTEQAGSVEEDGVTAVPATDEHQQQQQQTTMVTIHVKEILSGLDDAKLVPCRHPLTFLAVNGSQGVHTIQLFPATGKDTGTQRNEPTARTEQKEDGEEDTSSGAHIQAAADAVPVLVEHKEYKARVVSHFLLSADQQTGPSSEVLACVATQVGFAPYAAVTGSSVMLGQLVVHSTARRHQVPLDIMRMAWSTGHSTMIAVGKSLKVLSSGQPAISPPASIDGSPTVVQRTSCAAAGEFLSGRSAALMCDDSLNKQRYVYLAFPYIAPPTKRGGSPLESAASPPLPTMVDLEPYAVAACDDYFAVGGRIVPENGPSKVALALVSPVTNTVIHSEVLDTPKDGALLDLAVWQTGTRTLLFAAALNSLLVFAVQSAKLHLVLNCPVKYDACSITRLESVGAGECVLVVGSVYSGTFLYHYRTHKRTHEWELADLASDPVPVSVVDCATLTRGWFLRADRKNRLVSLAAHLDRVLSAGGPAGAPAGAGTSPPVSSTESAQPSPPRPPAKKDDCLVTLSCEWYLPSAITAICSGRLTIPARHGAARYRLSPFESKFVTELGKETLIASADGALYSVFFVKKDCWRVLSRLVVEVKKHRKSPRFFKPPTTLMGDELFLQEEELKESLSLSNNVLKDVMRVVKTEFPSLSQEQLFEFVEDFVGK